MSAIPTPFDVVFLAMLLRLTTMTSQACVGARALGMGGAFIAVADDASTTYWNPAGLALMGTRQATGMFIPGEEINYKYFASYSQAVGDQSALAASFFEWNPIPLGYVGANLLELDAMRPWISFATRLPTPGRPDSELAVGANLSFTQASLSLGNQKESLDVDFGFDVSVLYKINAQWSLGMLIQDVNEPALRLDGEKLTQWQRNIRPGVAFRPNEQLTLAMDVYDLAGEKYLMAGADYRISEKIGVRGGVYAMGGADYVTVGAGYHFSPAFSLDITVMDFEHFVFSATGVF